MSNIICITNSKTKEVKEVSFELFKKRFNEVFSFIGVDSSILADWYEVESQVDHTKHEFIYLLDLCKDYILSNGLEDEIQL